MMVALKKYFNISCSTLILRKCFGWPVAEPGFVFPIQRWRSQVLHIADSENIVLKLSAKYSIK